MKKTVQKQLTQWREDFDRYWQRTSLVARIIIGAVVSLILVFAVTKFVNRPLAKEVKRLRKETSGGESADSAMMLIKEFNAKKKRLESKIKFWRKKLETANDRSHGISSVPDGEVIIELRRMFDDCNLKLISEKRLATSQQSKKGQSGSGGTVKKLLPPGKNIVAKNNHHMRLKLPEYMSSIDYHFSVVGRFGDICRFLRAASESQYVFILNNAVMGASRTVVYDSRMRPEPGVKMDFEIHVPYLNKGYL